MGFHTAGYLLNHLTGKAGSQELLRWDELAPIAWANHVRTFISIFIIRKKRKVKLVCRVGKHRTVEEETWGG
jgi:hypothetical protein